MLGPLSIMCDGREVKLSQAMVRRTLAVLLCRANTPVSIDVLADALWGNAPPAHARKTVQLYVHRLRTILRDPTRITHSSGGYLLVVSPGERDVDQAEDLVKAAGSATEPRRRAGLLREALALWRGVPMVEFADLELVRPLSDRLADRRIGLLTDRIDVDLELGRHTDLIGELTELVTHHPLHERFRAQLMLALYRSGRQADALACYLDAQRCFALELGIEPSAELRNRHAAILRHDPVLDFAPPRIRPAQLLAPPWYFTGRAAELARLDNMLGTKNHVQEVGICVISGTAGVGKTSLAIQWAHRVSDQFPDGQLYVNLRGFDPSGAVMSASEAITCFLDALNVAPQRIPMGLDRQVGLYRSVLAGRRMLVVLDNARDTTQVRPLLPGSSGCVVVVTSRNELTGLVATEGAHALTLNLLSDTEALELLGRRLGAGRVAAEPSAVRDIIQFSARLPIALAIMAGRATEQRQFPLSLLAAELRAACGGLDPFTIGDDDPACIRTILSSSYRTLSDAAATLFRQLGLHPGPDIAMPTARSLAGLTREELLRPLTELCRTHLIEQHHPGRFTMHDLLRSYALELATTQDTESDRLTTTTRILDHYMLSAYAASRLLEPHRETINIHPPAPDVIPAEPATVHQTLNWYTSEQPNLIAAVRHAATHGFSAHAWQLAWTVTTFQQRRGHWHDLITAQRAALDITSQQGDLIGQAHAHRGLARAFLRLAQNEQAARHLHHAMTLYQQLGDCLGQARAHLGLNLTSAHLGDYIEALKHAEHALSLFQKAGHRSGQAEAHNAIGWSHAELRNYELTLTHCNTALALLQQLDDHHTEGNTWDSLGYAHHRLGHHHNALNCYRHALVAFQETGERYLQAETLTRIGDTHHGTGNIDAAHTAWQRAINILADLNHPETHQTRIKLQTSIAKQRHHDQPTTRHGRAKFPPRSGLSTERLTVPDQCK